MSDIFNKLSEAVSSSDYKEIEDIIYQLKNVTNPNELFEFKKSYNYYKLSFFSLIGRSKLTPSERQELINNISFVISKESNNSILPQKRKGENHEDPLEKLKKAKTSEWVLEEEINNFENTEELLNFGYSPEHILSLNKQKDSEKLIRLLLEVHNSKIILPNIHDLYSLAMIGQDNLRSYLNHSNSLRKLNFTSDEIYTLLVNNRPVTRIPLLITHYEDFKRINLTQLEILRVFTYNTGSKSIDNVLKYLPSLREKKCPLTCVKSITNKTTGSILKIIAENYLIFAQKDWAQLELTIDVGFKELKDYVIQMKNDYVAQNATSLVNNNFLSPQIVTNTPNLFFQQTSNTTVNTSKSKMDLSQLVHSMNYHPTYK